MEDTKEEMVRVLVPHDSGFASGGLGPLRFPYNFLWGLFLALSVLLSPWSWWSHLHRLFIFPIQERRRTARGEAPTGYEYAEYPATMTLDELVKELGYDPQEIKGDGGDLGNYQRDYGDKALKDIKPEVVTEAISWAHVSHW